MKQILFLLIFVFTAMSVSAQETVKVQFDLSETRGGEQKMVKDNIRWGDVPTEVFNDKYSRRLAMFNDDLDEWLCWLAGTVLPEDVKPMLDTAESEFMVRRPLSMSTRINSGYKDVNSQFRAMLYFDTDLNLIKVTLLIDNVEIAGKLSDEQLRGIHDAILKENIPADVKKTIVLPSDNDGRYEYFYEMINFNASVRAIEDMKKEDPARWNKIRKKYDKTSNETGSL